MNRKKRKNGLYGTVGTMVAFVAVMLVVYFVVLNNPNGSQEGKIPATELGRLLAKDMEGEYPANPREVVKWYGRYSKCMYDESISEEDLGLLMDQMRLLFAADFLENNPRDKQLAGLLEERKEYRKTKRRLSEYSVQKSSQVRYKEVESQEMASIGASFILTDEKEYGKVYQEFMLRKEEGNWKIVGFQNVEPMDIEESE